LPQVVARPDDLPARGAVLAGAYLAGASFAAAGSGIHHKICHVLGGAYDLPHAEMHTVILPHAIAFVAPYVPAAMVRAAAALGDADVAGAIYDLGRAVGAPPDLAVIGMPGDRLDEAAGLIAEAARGSAIPVTTAAMRALLGDAYAGLRPAIQATPATPAPPGPIAPPITA
jgi:maleylacetate reductase